MNVHRQPSEFAAPRMAALARLPVFFALAGKRVLLAGDNAAAAWKAELLSAAGALVDVCSPQPSDELLALARDAQHVRIAKRQWQDADFHQAILAIGAFESDEEAARFANAARKSGVPVNVVDRPAHCDFSFGAIVNRSPLVIGISTDGAAPVFGQAIRAKLEALIPRGFARWAEAAQQWRSRIQSLRLSFADRRRVWETFTERAIRDPNREPTDRDLEIIISQAIDEKAGRHSGSVVLVGAGPGDPELLTLRAVRALQSADIILFDDLVAPEILDFARREAKKMMVGKTGHEPSCKQDEINALMISLAKSGRRVVRLKGGDPMVFGRANEEIAACRKAGISVDIIPGISAAQAAASRLQVSLTDRSTSRRVQFITGYAAGGGLPADMDWKGLADSQSTLAVYMPVKTLAQLSEKLIAAGLAKSTPAIAISRATRIDETVVWGTVSNLAERIADARLKSPVLVLIGLALEQATSKLNNQSQETSGEALCPA